MGQRKYHGKRYKEILLTNEYGKLLEAKKKEFRRFHVCLSYMQRTRSLQEMKNNGKEMDLSGYPYVLEQAEEVEEAYLEKIRCRLLGLPCEILQTKRCIVREICLDDVDKLYEIYADPSITLYMEGLYAKRKKKLPIPAIISGISTVFMILECGSLKTGSPGK